MALKIILAISLVGFLAFECYNLIHAIIQRKRAKQQRIAEQQQADNDKNSDKEVNE